MDGCTDAIDIVHRLVQCKDRIPLAYMTADSSNGMIQLGQETLMGSVILDSWNPYSDHLPATALEQVCCLTLGVRGAGHNNDRRFLCLLHGIELTQGSSGDRVGISGYILIGKGSKGIVAADDPVRRLACQAVGNFHGEIGAQNDNFRLILRQMIGIIVPLCQFQKVFCLWHTDKLFGAFFTNTKSLPKQAPGICVLIYLNAVCHGNQFSRMPAS